MTKKRAIIIADRTAPLALTLVSAANLLFLASFLAALAVAIDVVGP
ncbi:MAG: hypothetical protein KF810_18760 [Rhizobiaceae bacterium]|nr:hypothetical protein [Rhizobiaceae bacterium]